MFHKSILLCAGICFWSFASYGQQKVFVDSLAEKIFQEGVAAFEAGKLASAEESFRALIQKHGTSQRITAAFIMHAKTLLQLKRPFEAIASLQPIFIQFPGSTYIADACAVRGEACIALNDFAEALRSFCIELQYTTPRSGRENAIREKISSMFERLSAIEREEIINEGEDGRTSATMRYLLAMHHYQHAQIDSASTELRKIDDSFQTEEIMELHQKILRERGSTTEIMKMWVVLPNEKADAYQQRIISDIKDGIYAAVESWNRQSSRKISMHTYQRRSPDDFKNFIEQIANDQYVLGAIGGIFTDDAEEEAPYFQAKKIPFVVPIATGDGITSIGDYVFQCNTPLRMRGAAQALYAARYLFAKHAAIIAPLDSYAKELAEAFQETAAKLGLVVDVTSWYKVGSQSLASQFQTVKKYLSDHDSIDVLYLPTAKSHEIAMLAHEFEASGMKATILGSAEWNDPQQLRRITATLATCDFEVDYFVDEESEPYRTFLRNYARITQSIPTKHSVFGYDAAMVFLETTSKGRLTREALQQRLVALKYQLLLRSRLSFDPMRANTCVRIVRHKQGVTRFITDIDTGDFLDERK